MNERDRYDIFFEPTGEITGTAGPASWELQGRKLTMRWKDPNAPGGFWVDIVTVDPEPTGYEGRNQNGLTIAGGRRN